MYICVCKCRYAHNCSTCNLYVLWAELGHNQFSVNIMLCVSYFSRLKPEKWHSFCLVISSLTMAISKPILYLKVVHYTTGP